MPSFEQPKGAVNNQSFFHLLCSLSLLMMVFLPKSYSIYSSFFLRQSLTRQHFFFQDFHLKRFLLHIFFFFHEHPFLLFSKFFFSKALTAIIFFNNGKKVARKEDSKSRKHPTSTLFIEEKEERLKGR